MIKIITAIGNPNLNNELNKHSEFEVPCKDIQYIEGILEFLEANSDINFIIVSELLEGQITLEQLVNKVISINRKIKLIAIIDKKNINLEKKLLSNGVYDILYDGIDIFSIISLLKNKNVEVINEELKAEIDKLKQIVLNRKSEKNNIFNKLKKIKNSNLIENKKCRIITVIGNRGIGKTTFSIELSDNIKKNKRVLLIDFDVLNNNISYIYDLKNTRKYEIINNNYIDNKSENIVENSRKNMEKNRKENIKNNINTIKKNITKIDKNLSVLGNINFLLYNKKININYLEDIIQNVKNEYDYIIIDTYSESIFELNKSIFSISDYILLLTQVNKLEIEKTKNMLDFLFDVWKINISKVNIIIYKYKILDYIFFNKLKNNSILKNIRTIGKIRYNTFFNICSNLNLKKIYIIKNKLNYHLILKNINKI